MTAQLTIAALCSPLISLPDDLRTNVFMLLRWVHIVAAILWVGLLYFFNLVNVPFLRELDTPTQKQDSSVPHVARALVVSDFFGRNGARRTCFLG